MRFIAMEKSILDHLGKKKVVKTKPEFIFKRAIMSSHFATLLCVIQCL